MTLNTSEPIAVESPLEASDEPDADKVAPRRLGVSFWAAIGWILLISAAALVAPWLPLTDPEEIGAGGRLEGPSWDNWFGTDSNGRDLFSRTIWGARVSLMVGLVSILAGFLIGGVVGVVSGYLRGITDRILSFGIFVMLSFPSLVLFLLIISKIGRAHV